MFRTILFDLDGTLTDPGEGITNSVAFALEHYGIHVSDRTSLYPFIGPPLQDSFMKYYGMDEQRTDAAIEVYREYFSAKGWMENRVYDGIESLLCRLQQAGKQLIVATSKPETFALRILEYFGLYKYFNVVCGAPLHPQKGYGKADVIKTALERAGIKDFSNVVMVGDRRHDIQGAHKVGIAAVGVLYGYGDRLEHETCGADYIAEDIVRLEELLLQET